MQWYDSSQLSSKGTPKHYAAIGFQVLDLRSQERSIDSGIAEFSC